VPTVPVAPDHSALVVYNDGPGESRSLDDLIADCAEVRRNLASLQPRVLPLQRAITIPQGAADLVAGLDSYGD
jgi:hypothetical protein